MNNLNASKGVNTSALSVVKKNALTGFKATGRALTYVLDKPNTMAFALRGGALVGALVGGYINPWTIPAGAAAGATVGVCITCFTGKDEPGEPYDFNVRLMGSLAFGLMGLCLAWGSTFASDLVWENYSPEGKAFVQKQAEDKKIALEEKAKVDKIAFERNAKIHKINMIISDARTVQTANGPMCQIKGQMADDQSNPIDRADVTQQIPGACKISIPSFK